MMNSLLGQCILPIEFSVLDRGQSVNSLNYILWTYRLIVRGFLPGQGATSKLTPSPSPSSAFRNWPLLLNVLLSFFFLLIGGGKS